MADISPAARSGINTAITALTPHTEDERIAGLISKLEAVRDAREEDALEDALIKSDLGLPDDRSRAGLERAYLEKMSPSAAQALERNATRA